MALQINQFWMLKGHSTISSTNEYEPDVLCNGDYKNSKYLKRMFELISSFTTYNFAVF